MLVLDLGHVGLHAINVSVISVRLRSVCLSVSVISVISVGFFML